MTPPRQALLAALLGASLAACGPLKDEVFASRVLDHTGEPLELVEGAGTVEIPLLLATAPAETVSARYHFAELEAQSTCQSPDFSSPDGRVVWPAGQRRATVSLLVRDDNLPELDEALSLVLDDFSGAGLHGSDTVRLVILDDDRTGIIDARAESGLLPGVASDQAGALGDALARAAALGRGVVWVAPGDYEVSGVTLPVGVTLSGRGATLHRPASSPGTTVGIGASYRDDIDSPATLIEGLTLDGRRDEQGPFENDQLTDAHLVSLRGDPERAGQLRVTLESLGLESSTASGVFLGPGVNATLCRLHGADLWRNVVTLRGGHTRVDARELDASASLGTTGLWFDGQPAGFGGTHRINVTVRDTQLASGDLEIEAYDGSTIELDRFSMARGPLRLQAPDATVTITDSVLQAGLPSAVHNFFGLPHDVTLTRTTLVATETDDGGLETVDADRTLAVSTVRWELMSNMELPPLLPAASPPHRIVFDQCTFLRGPDVETTDTVYGVATEGRGGSVVVRAPVLDANVEALSPSCDGCTLE